MDLIHIRKLKGSEANAGENGSLGTFSIRSYSGKSMKLTAMETELQFAISDSFHAMTCLSLQRLILR